MSNAPEPKPSPLGVDDIVAPPISTPSEEDKNAALNALEAKTLANDALRQLIKGRGDWGTRIFRIMVGWLVSVILCVSFEGFRLFGFHLPDSLIIAFITTTTVNVIGLGYIVAKYFFASKD